MYILRKVSGILKYLFWSSSNSSQLVTTGMFLVGGVFLVWNWFLLFLLLLNVPILLVHRNRLLRWISMLKVSPIMTVWFLLSPIVTIGLGSSERERERERERGVEAWLNGACDYLKEIEDEGSELGTVKNIIQTFFVW